MDWIEEVSSHCLDHDDPSEAIWVALELAVKGVGAAGAKLYVRHVDTGQYRQDFHLTGGVRAEASEPAQLPVGLENDSSTPTSDYTLLRSALEKGSVSWFDVVDRNRSRYLEPLTYTVCVVPLVRLKNRIGFVLIEARTAHAWSAERHQLTLLQTILALLLEKRSALRLLTTLYQPIDFLTTLSEFLDRVLSVAATASGMSHIALRELSRDKLSLRCLNTVGFENVDDVASLDLDPLSDYPTFQRALAGETVSEPNMGEPHLVPLVAKPALAKIRSFVVAPVNVGKDVFGTLSFAATIPHNYSRIDLAGFEALANAIGVAISNQRNAEQLSQVTESYVQTGMTFTALEVAQAARHEAREYVDNAQVALASIRLASQKMKDSRILLETIDRCADSMQQVSFTIDKIRDASKVRKGERTEQSVLDVWKQAVGLVSGRLRSLNVTHRMTKDVHLPIYPELIRILFANLLLNSLDAFERKHRSRGHKPTITLQVEDSSPRSNMQVLRYVDNAGGLDQAALRALLVGEISPSQERSLVSEFIFERGITTKEKGSGYGLYIARRAANEHRGSIRLHDSREGVVFDIELPKTV